MSESPKSRKQGGPGRQRRPRQKSRKPVTDAIQVVLEEGRRVRERIGRIVTDQMQGDEFSAENLAKTARHVMDAAMQSSRDTFDKVVPPEKESVLRDIVYGIGDAFGTAAKTARATLDKAREEGREFASEDVRQMTVELRNLNSSFVDSVIAAATCASERTTAFVQSATQHANQAAREIKPEIEKALSAAAQHPIQLTKDAAKAGLDVTREVAGSLFAVLGDMMNKAADALRVEKDRPEAAPRAAAPRAKAPPRKGPE